MIFAGDHSIVTVTFDSTYTFGGSPDMTAEGSTASGFSILDLNSPSGPSSIDFQTNDGHLLVPGTFALYFVQDFVFANRVIVLPIEATMTF